MTRGRHVRSTARSAWRPLAAAAIGGAVLLTTGFGVWASLLATASSAAPQQVSTGTLSLTLGATGTGFSQPVPSIAPGDTVHRYVTLTNGGTLAGRDLSLAVSASTANLLTGTAAGSLRLSVTSCSTAWTPTTGACTGGTTAALLAPTALGALTGPAVLVPGTVAAASVTRLQVTLFLPDTDEVTTNGVPPASTVQGLSTTLTYLFSERQRTATTTGS